MVSDFVRACKPLQALWVTTVDHNPSYITFSQIEPEGVVQRLRREPQP
jgi:hypothetical protein